MLRLPEPEEHRPEPEEHVPGPAVGAAERLRDRVIRAMGEGVAVDHEQRSSCERRFELGDGALQPVGGDLRTLGLREPVEISQLDGGAVPNP